MPNQNNTFKTTSTQSHKSMGHHLNAVCLFDLRQKTTEQIEHGIYLYDFLGIHRPKKNVCYLILNRELHSSLTTLEDLNDEIKNSKMYIPEIESWHVGPINLDQLSQVYELSVVD